MCKINATDGHNIQLWLTFFTVAIMTQKPCRALRELLALQYRNSTEVEKKANVKKK